MRRYYTSLLMVLSAVSGLQWLIDSFPSAVQSSVQPQISGSESRLALGRTVDMWTAEVYDLELIPKISDKLARRMLLGRADMRAQASTLPREEKYQALESVKGIGPKTAKRLSRYLSLTSPAAAQDSSR